MIDYIENWLKVIENMNNDNTYKLAWGRAIVECVNNAEINDNDLIIEFVDISKCMIRYYWNQMFFFKLKQSPYTNSDPVVCKLVNELIDEYKKNSQSEIPVWFEEGIKIIDNKFYNSIVKKVSTTLTYDVSWRFKMANKEEVDLYDYDKRKGLFIVIKKENAIVLKDYAIIVSKLLNYKWTQLLETYNFAPKIAKKVNGLSIAKLKRNSLSKYKEELLKQFKGGKIIDFYTNEELDKKDISIDHVIPWSFMYSDDIWNLVITSKSNNSSKSNKIPAVEMIEKLEQRNKILKNIVSDKYKNDLEVAEQGDYVRKFYYDSRG